MSEFRYRAVDDQGEQATGSLTAESAEEVVRYLERQGLQVSSVRPIGHGRLLPRRRGVSPEDLAMFNEQLQAIVKSGLPLAPSLEALGRDVRSRRLRQVVDQVRAELEGGRTLSDALDRHPDIFSPVYRSVVRAGERSGDLAAGLAALTSYSDRSLELKHRLQEAVAYPTLVVVAALAVMTYYNVQVVPGLSLSQLFFDDRGLDANLPPGSILVRYLAPLTFFVVAVPAAAWVLARLASRLHYVRFAVDRLKLRLPALGELAYDVAVARFARTLALLLQSRVPLPDALPLAGAASGNALAEEAARRARASVEEGFRLSEGLRDTGFFRQTFLWLLATGETRNDLERVLSDLADAHDRAAERATRFVAATAGPVCTVVAALVVALVMLSVYQPLLRSLGSLGDVLGGG